MGGDLLLVATRLAVYATVPMAFGVALFADPWRRKVAVGAPPSPRALLTSLAVLGVMASVLQIAAMAASMAGVEIGQLDRQTFIDLIGGSAIGYAWSSRIVALILLGVVAIMPLRQPGVMRVSACLASGIATATLAWTGHGAADEGSIGWFHLAADMLHLLVAGAWIGAIVSLLLLVRTSQASVAESATHAYSSLHRFALTGTILVATIIATGIVNMWFLVPWARLLSLADQDYGRLLLTKLALFAAMLGLAAANRYRLTPALGRSIATDDRADAFAALRRSLTIELGCAAAVIALVAWLGTLSPLSAT